MTPIKIAYLHPSNELYGADRSLLRLVRGLDPEKYAVNVFVPNDIEYDGMLTAELKKLNIPYHEIGLGVLRRRYKSIWGILQFAINNIRSTLWLSRFVRKNQIELIHTNSTAVLVGGFVCWLTGAKHIWHVREILVEPKWLNLFMANFLSVFADQVVAVSGPVKQHLEEEQPKLNNKIEVVHNGIDVEQFLASSSQKVENLRKEWGIPTDAILIGMVGRISHWKGQEFLIAAAAPVLLKYPHTRLVLVGDVVPGDVTLKQELDQLIEAFGIQEQVTIESFRLDIPAVLSTFDIFVLPSIRPDPFPTVVLEALAAGRAVVATRHGGAIEQIEDKVSGILVSPETPSEMSDALELLCTDSSYRLKLGEAGRQRALMNFQTATYVKNVERLYERMLSVRD